MPLFTQNLLSNNAEVLDVYLPIVIICHAKIHKVWYRILLDSQIFRGKSIAFFCFRPFNSRNVNSSRICCVIGLF